MMKIKDLVIKWWKWGNEKAVSVPLEYLIFTWLMCTVLPVWFVESYVAVILLSIGALVGNWTFWIYRHQLVELVQRFSDSFDIPKVEDENTSEMRDQTPEEISMYEELTEKILHSLRNDWGSWQGDSLVTSSMARWKNDKLKISIYPDVWEDKPHLGQASIYDDTQHFQRFKGFTKEQRNRISVFFYNKNLEWRKSEEDRNKLYEEHRVNRLNKILKGGTSD